MRSSHAPDSFLPIRFSWLGPIAQADRPLVLFVLTGGGFSFETTRLLTDLGGDFDFVYLKTEYGGTPGEYGIPEGEAHVVPQFATKTKSFLGRSVFAFLVTLKMAWAVMRRLRVDAAVGIGCSHALPTFVAGRLLGVRTIYIESVTRTDRLSLTGKIVYHLGLSSHFIIQWPDLQKAYPGSALGTII